MSCSLRPRWRETSADAPPSLKALALWLCDRETSADVSSFLKASFTHLRMRACTHTPRERASERGEREGERERERGRERARERERVRAPFFQVCPAHHIVSARQAYAHLPCFLRPGYPLPPRPSETLQRSPDVDAPPPRPRRHSVHPSARPPRPLDPGPRMPPPQRGAKHLAGCPFHP